MWCGILTAILVVRTLLQSDTGEVTATQHRVQFRKVLAANSFSWIGVQSMFVFMVAYVQYRLPALDDIAMGRLVSMSFLVLTVVVYNLTNLRKPLGFSSDNVLIVAMDWRNDLI